jgi:hypothetical protein
MLFLVCYSHYHVLLYPLNWPDGTVLSSRELWTGIANCVPPPPTSPHLTVRCGLVGGWVALLSTAAHSYIHTLHFRQWVGIATGYWLDGLGIESRWGRDYLHPSRPALGPTQAPMQWVSDLFPGGKAAGAWS